MNTTTKTGSTTASTTTILAIDLGKYKSVACVYDDGSGEFRFTTFETTRAELQMLVGKERPAIVVIEACLLAGWVHDLCAELGVRCLVANTASEAWKFKHLKRKTDKDDALRLAQLHLLGQLPTVSLPPTAVRQWRSLIACRQAIVGRRIAVQNRIRALFVAQGLPAPRGAKAWAATGLAGMASWAKPLGRVDIHRRNCNTHNNLWSLDHFGHICSKPLYCKLLRGDCPHDLGCTRPNVPDGPAAVCYALS